MPESTKGVMSAVEFENAANDFRKAAPGNKAHFGLMALLTHDAAMRKELETAQKARDALREENERLRAAVRAMSNAAEIYGNYYEVSQDEFEEVVGLVNQ